MPVPPEQHVKLDQKFNLFPFPQIKPINFAVAYGTTDPSGELSDPKKHISVKSRIGLLLPFHQEALPYRVSLTSPMDHNPPEFPPTLETDLLDLSVKTNHFDLISVNLGDWNRLVQPYKPEYPPEAVSALETMILSVFDQHRRLISLPSSDLLDSGFYYQQFLETDPKEPISKGLIGRFRSGTLTGHQLPRDLTRIAAMEGQFSQI